ncbi:MAG: SUMF1/EgtB/PvdO family nonheme iron enzyme, partial [Elusimicrobia bacterium]|nr:SUMF1/EgtB/PvdO family nonheme iron enzyme [Elusimicrobiota bacterium]
MMPDGRHALSTGEDGLGVWELDWKYSFPEQSDWDPGARPYAESFLAAHKTWTDADFKGLLEELGRRGYGWLKPEGVRRKLETAAKTGWGEEAEAAGKLRPVSKNVWIAAGVAAAVLSAAFLVWVSAPSEVKEEKPGAKTAGFNLPAQLSAKPAAVPEAAVRFDSGLGMITWNKPAAKPEEPAPAPEGPKANLHYIFNIPFRPGTLALSARGEGELKQAGLIAPDYPQEQVEVVGYAGPSEPDAEALARNRAQIAADYLVGKARIPSGRVQRRSVVSSEGTARAEIRLLSEAGEAVRASEPVPEGARTSQGKAGIVWVRIPGGSFMMGDEEWSDSKPRRQVRVKAFEMAKSEVTNKQYRACVDAGACTPPSSYVGGDDQPVVNVDWNQAKKFSEWAGGRLPSEAEWEYAARSAGKDWKYPWGNEEATCAKAVMSEGGLGCGKSSTWPVCSKSAGNTKQGLCDMAGNVWEWTQDWYHDSYNGAP